MGVAVIRLPDVGEGIAEAEIAAVHVRIGDVIREDDPIADIMTDKAAVEIPSSVGGTVLWIAGDVGDTLAVGAELIHIEVEGDGDLDVAVTHHPTQSNDDLPNARASTENTVSTSTSTPPDTQPRPVDTQGARAASHTPSNKPLAAPSVRGKARDADVDLRLVPGTGPGGRITHNDLTGFINSGSSVTGLSGRVPDNSVTDIKVTGLRRKIAEQMVRSKSSIPHITIVEEVDVTECEALRAQLNADYADTRQKLTVLPFIMSAMVVAIREQPMMNAHYLEETSTLRQSGGVHIGVATQTPRGLVVPVVRHTESLRLWECAEHITRLAEAAREGKADRAQLSGSTITITSLGPLGALATTPIINHPEVAIVGVNRMAIRPHWDGKNFIPRKMMNISCSFDHRVIDGWDAAVFVQRLKTLLEKPALIFLET